MLPSGISPFQGWIVHRDPRPRAVPWADGFGPFGAQEGLALYLHPLVLYSKLAFASRGRLVHDSFTICIQLVGEGSIIQGQSSQCRPALPGEGTLPRRNIGAVHTQAHRRRQKRGQARMSTHYGTPEPVPVFGSGERLFSQEVIYSLRPLNTPRKHCHATTAPLALVFVANRLIPLK
jgi:hypothetical protein